MARILSTLEARLACVEVFALGAAARHGAAPTSAITRRARCIEPVRPPTPPQCCSNAASPNLSAPVVGGLVTEIAARFGVVVSERSAASALPVLGAVGGATVNVIFMNHFQRVARGHFAIRRLERQYGPASCASSTTPTHRDVDDRSIGEVNNSPMDAKASAVSRGTATYRRRPPPGTYEQLSREASRGLRRMRPIATLLLVAMTDRLHRHLGDEARLAVDPVSAGLCRSRHGRRLRRLVRDRGAVPPAVRACRSRIPASFPNNKDRIGGALGRFMTNNFLTASAMNERLARIDVSARSRAGSDIRAIERKAAGGICGRVAAAGRKLAARTAARRIRRQPDAAGAGNNPGRAGGFRIIADRLGARRGAGPDFAHIVEYSETWLDDNKDYLSRKISQQSSSWIPEMDRQDDCRQGARTAF